MTGQCVRAIWNQSAFDGFRKYCVIASFRIQLEVFDVAVTWTALLRSLRVSYFFVEKCVLASINRSQGGLFVAC